MCMKETRNMKRESRGGADVKRWTLARKRGKEDSQGNEKRKTDREKPDREKRDR